MKQLNERDIYIKNVSNFFLNKQSFEGFFKDLLDNDFAEVESYILCGLEMKRLPNRSKDQIIEGSLGKTPKEIEKKREDKNYYECNALCVMNVLRKVYTKELLDFVSCNNAPPIALDNYSHILKYCILDIDELINAFQCNLKNNCQYEYNSNRSIHYQSVHQILRQSLYGQLSAHSFCDMEISSSIALIRQLIELRIRRAFGVICFQDNQGNIKPLDMSTIFEVVKKYKNEIKFPMKLENIERIYKWSNMFVHSGLSELSWIPYFIEIYLRPLTFGEKVSQNNWSINNGIKTSRSIIDNMKQDLCSCTNYTILSCTPECELLH